MREIKFRVYGGNWSNEPRQRMLYCGNITDSDFYRPEEGYVYMQYTGLKDKNGKEIYESDIVKGTAYEFNGCPRIIGEVIYDYCEYKVKSIRRKTSLLKAELNTTYEVIGNIFEDGDLLDDRQITKKD